MDSDTNMAGQVEQAQAEEAMAVDAPVTEAEVAAEVEHKADARPSTVEDLKPGMRVKGRVRNVVEFGAFVDIGVGRDGLAHISTLKRAGLDKTIQVGDMIDVQVRRVDLDTNRISLTVPGAGRGAKTALQDLEVGALVPGRVVRLVDFGAFVDIGAQADGLLHVSQLQGYVRHPSDVFKPGDEVEVKILEVDTQRRRISLTMKMEEREPERVVAGPAPVEDDEPQMSGIFAAAWEKALDSRRSRRQQRS